MGSAETRGAAARDAKSRSAESRGGESRDAEKSLVSATLAGFARAPRALAAAAVLVAVEGLLLVGLGVWQVVRGFGSHIDDLGRAEFGGVLSLACGVVVIGLARAQVVRQETSKSPIVVIQLLCLPVGWAMLDNGLTGYGVPLLIVAIAVLALLVTAGLTNRSRP